MRNLSKTLFVLLMGMNSLSMGFVRVEAAVIDPLSVTLVKESEIPSSPMNVVTLIPGENYDYKLALFATASSLQPTLPKSVIFSGQNSRGESLSLPLFFLPKLRVTEKGWAIWATPLRPSEGDFYQGVVKAVFSLPPGDLVDATTRPVLGGAEERNFESAGDSQTDPVSTTGPEQQEDVTYGAQTRFTNAVILVGNAAGGESGLRKTPLVPENQAESVGGVGCGVISNPLNSQSLILILSFALLVFVFRQIQDRKKLKV